MNILETIEHQGVTFKIVRVDLTEVDKLGEVDFIKQEIRLDIKLRGDMLWQVFCHELQHIFNNEMDHTLIESQGQSMYSIIKQLRDYE